jgi:hypothetical protein
MAAASRHKLSVNGRLPSRRLRAAYTRGARRPCPAATVHRPNLRPSYHAQLAQSLICFIGASISPPRGITSVRVALRVGA